VGGWVGVSVTEVCFRGSTCVCVSVCVCVSNM